MSAPLPADEPQRLDELLKLNVLAAPADPQLQMIAEIAASIFQVPIALVSLVDAERQLFKARVGLVAEETCRDYAFCAYAILQSDPLIVENAAEDPRFASNPLVTSAPHIRFYAGAPLVTRKGYRLGTLCVIDSQPRKLAAGQAATLKLLAALAVDIIQTRQRVDVAEARARQSGEGNGLSSLQLSAFGHELRTPLNHILGFVDLLKTNLAGDEEGRHARNLEYLDIVQQSGAHLAALVDKILDLDAPGFEDDLRLESLDLNEVLGQVVKSFEGTCAAKGQRLGFVPSAVPVPALADLTSVRQIAINLISNASKYSPEGATIEVTTRLTDGPPCCLLVVEDNGPGMPQSVLDRLGEPFVRGAAAREKQQGSGLGLHLTLRLSQAMNGAVHFEPRPGGGTRATLRLPVPGRILGCEPRLVSG